MEIKNIGDLKIAAGEMHDSEFKENDFGFNYEKKSFFLNTFSPDTSNRIYFLELDNVDKYSPLNLDKIKKGKATGGVFDSIEIKNNGLDLVVISQDLRIKLKLNKLAGRFEIRCPNK